MSESTIDAAAPSAMLREERKMNQDWILPDPQEVLVDKIPTEDKIEISNKYGLWVDGEQIIWDDEEPVRPIEPWREMAPEERLLLYMQILDMVPEEQLSEEVREAIGEAIAETERLLCEPR
jgi:hypothetical protein